MEQAQREQTYKKLIELAKEAAGKTYSPYSEFPVGAALLSVDGQTFTGCNVENASYGGSICAERTAFVKAVSEGATRFSAIAVVCEKSKDSWPCGLCRQFMAEFGVDLDVITEKSDGSIQVLKLGVLLPHHFGPADLPSR